jgi:serine/threonine protein kinase/Flp pilus assembly protein TadD
MGECPTREQLACLLDERLTNPESSTVEAHVQTCPRCQGTLHELSDHILPGAETTRSPTARSEYEPSPEFLHRLMANAPHPATPGNLTTTTWGTDPTFDARTRGVPGYELLAELGRGGMGVVYKAWQTRVGRLTAIKMVLAGPHAGAEQLARFRTEAEAVARLHHANIVQIFDVGEQDGRPYLVLEYVDGDNLETKLAGAPLAARQAAKLVETLADAVHYAHERGVVHRDLTPRNVLLTSTGQPKITDFGLAKLRAGGVGQTVTGEILGTPSYMAPEQAAGKAQDVGPATDVYALGAILYDALTGRPPFKAETPLDTMLQVTTTDPVPPGRLQPKLPRDLETISLKCLRKEPQRRYGTALELAEDLRRFLAGEPIRARPIPLWERGIKWVKRRPALAAMLGGAAVTLGTGLLLLAWENERTREQRDLAVKNYVLAAEQEQKAKSEAAKVAAMNRFLTNDILFQAAPENNPRSKQVTIEEVLNRAADRVETAFADQPEVEAEIRHAIARTYFELGLYQKAEPHARRALTLFRDRAGEEAEGTMLTLNLLALVLYNQGNRGNLAESEKLYRQVLETRRRASGPDHAETLIVMSNLADALTRADQWKEAEALHRQTLEARRRVLDPNDPAILVSLNNLGHLLLRRGRFDEAEPLLRQTVEGRRRLNGEEHPATLSAMDNLAALFEGQGKLSDAEPLHRQVLAGRRRVLGPENRGTLSTMNNLALVLKRRGKLDEAEPLYRQVLEARLRDSGPEHWQTLNVQYNLAALLLDVGKLTEAEESFRALLESYQRLHGTGHSDTLITQNRLAQTLLAEQQPDRAEPLLREALRLYRQAPSPDAYQTSTTLVLLGQALVARDQAAEAEPHLQEALAIRRRILGAGDIMTANVESILGDCLRAQGRYAEAEPLLLHGYEVLAKSEEFPPRWRDAVDRLIRLYEAWPKPEQAATWRSRREKQGGEKE